MEDFRDDSPKFNKRVSRGARPSKRRRSYFRVLDSKLETSTVESNTIRSGDASTPPSESSKDTGKSPEYSPGPDYRAGDYSEDGAVAETSIREPEAGSEDEASDGEHVDEEAEFEFRASDYALRDETQSNRNETARKPVASQYEGFNWRAATENKPNPWIAECNYGTAFLKYPIYAANQQLSSNSTQAPDPGWVNMNQPAQPLIRASWEGDFAIYSDLAEVPARCYGLKGCVSVKLCAQARRVVQRMPPAIRWEKVPKHCVWPKSFERWGPNDNNIAVFFFPSLTKYESAYDSLVMELVRDDMALKTRVMRSDSELLLFTSVELPPLFTRFQGKLYLWGVFRGDWPQL